MRENEVEKMREREEREMENRERAKPKNVIHTVQDHTYSDDKSRTGDGTNLVHFQSWVLLWL